MKNEESNECIKDDTNKKDEEILYIKKLIPKLMEKIDALNANHNSIERDIKKCLKIMKYYRVFIYDLNNNKVQNFSDRMKNVRQLEKIERIECMVNNINNILRENRKNIKEINKLAKKIN